MNNSRVELPQDYCWRTEYPNELEEQLTRAYQMAVVLIQHKEYLYDPMVHENVGRALEDYQQMRDSRTQWHRDMESGWNTGRKAK